MVVINYIVTGIYLLMVLGLVALLSIQVFKTKKFADKIAIAVVIVMFILRLFLIK